MGRFDSDDFERDVIERSRGVPVVADFWAAWCAPCRMLGPILERLAEQAGGRWELAKVDTEAHPDVAGRYGIRGIPAVKLFVDGEPVDGFVGALPEPAVREWLARVIPSPRAALVDRARVLASDGDAAAASSLLAEVLEAEPDDLAARLLLAELQVWDDPAAARATLGEIGPGTEGAGSAEAIREIARLLEALGDPDRLPESGVRLTYLAAIATLQRRDYAGALDGFIDVVRRDRAYDEDGARRACLAIFRLLGERDEVTRAYRGVFANAVMA